MKFGTQVDSQADKQSAHASVLQSMRIKQAERYIFSLALVLSFGQSAAIAEATTPNNDQELLQGTAEYSETSVESLLRTGISRHRAGDEMAAQRFFLRVLQIDSRNTNALFNLGAIAEQSGDLDQAHQYYLRAVKSSPNDENLIAAEQQVREAIASRKASLFIERRPPEFQQRALSTSDVMPPPAPAFAATIPARHNYCQANVQSQNASFRMPQSAANAETSSSGSGFMRTVLGVARVMTHNTCSLCGGWLRGW